MKSSLAGWQEKYAAARAAYEPELAKMERREALYRGSDEIEQITSRDKSHTKTTHVRNIIAENIESIVDSAIPGPVVSARRECDERLAKIIEDMLRNELDRLGFEQINDLCERTVPLQGAVFWHIEWDSREGEDGELSVTPVHPRYVIPQPGVCTSVSDMDYIFLDMPQTKLDIAETYGVIPDGDTEGDTEETVIKHIAYYKNGAGGIGRFSWCGETVLENDGDYQRRRARVCAYCGAREDEYAYSAGQTTDGTYPDGEKAVRAGAGICSFCGGRKWKTETLEYEYYEENCEKLIIPYYRPNIYPIVMQKNISVFDSFLGESDCDKISTQQNTINRLEMKIADKICQGGSVLTLPRLSEVVTNGRDMQVVYIGNAADKALIGSFNLQADISQDMSYMYQVYEEARQILGITDAYQGRNDSTSISGTAKRFAASQSAGRLESKRVMKSAAYADLFEAMFRFRLAYSDIKRPVVSRNENGDKKYDYFDKRDFIVKSENGDYSYTDGFLFSAETGSALRTT